MYKLLLLFNSIKIYLDYELVVTISYTLAQRSKHQKLPCQKKNRR